MKVLISGGYGFMGTALQRVLQSKGVRVDTIDNITNVERVRPSKNTNLSRHFDCDLTENVDAGVFGTDYTHIVHLAALLGVKNVIEKPSEVLRSNVQMSINMLRIASNQQTSPHFLYASTSEVYAGYTENQTALIPTPENVPITIPDLGQPRTTYMLSKVYGEAMVRQSGLPFTIFRPHNIYGPGMGFRHVIPQLIERALFHDGNFLRVYSPNHTRTFCFIEDAIEMIWRIMNNDRAIGQTLNLGNQNPEISMRSLAQLIIEIVGSQKLIKEAEDTAGSPKRRAPDMSECYNVIQYKPEHGLQDGIFKTLEHIKSSSVTGKLIHD